jgi:L-alanine-DL-glutamate epimerase-like enolase superfamily enzyme
MEPAPTGVAVRPRTRIATVECLTFEYVSHVHRDHEGHGHPGPARRAAQAVIRVRTTDGVDGHCVGGSPETAAVARRLLTGLDPLDRETIHGLLRRSARLEWRALGSRMIGVLDQALWDVAGRLVGLPVHKLLGASRDRVPAYASTMCGDEIPGGLATPADYAAFAKQLVELGYRAVKLHTWMPPARGGADVAADIAACAAVREAVGPDIELMLDAYHWYRRTDALRLGRALEELGYYWFEEPMEEASVSSYRWLADQLAIPVIGPETSWGKHLTRAEWVTAGACDILRAGVTDVGGITPTLKAMHLAEAFNIDCEVHGGGSGNLAVLGASSCGRWYERGLLHPLVDYDEVPPHLLSIVDPLGPDGRVPMPSRPGLGDDLNLEHIDANVVASW